MPRYVFHIWKDHRSGPQVTSTDLDDDDQARSIAGAEIQMNPAIDRIEVHVGATCIVCFERGRTASS